MIEFKANPGCCEEAALGLPFYAPCNKQATHVVGWKGRAEPPIRMCWMCADHNIRNRSGELVEGQDFWTRPHAEDYFDHVATLKRQGLKQNGEPS